MRNPRDISEGLTWYCMEPMILWYVERFLYLPMTTRLTMEIQAAILREYGLHAAIVMQGSTLHIEDADKAHARPRYSSPRIYSSDPDGGVTAWDGHGGSRKVTT